VVHPVTLAAGPEASDEAGAIDECTDADSEQAADNHTAAPVAPAAWPEAEADTGGRGCGGGLTGLNEPGAEATEAGGRGCGGGLDEPGSEAGEAGSRGRGGGSTALGAEIGRGCGGALTSGTPGGALTSGTPAGCTVAVVCDVGMTVAAAAVASAQDCVSVAAVPRLSALSSMARSSSGEWRVGGGGGHCLPDQWSCQACCCLARACASNSGGGGCGGVLTCGGVWISKVSHSGDVEGKLADGQATSLKPSTSMRLANGAFQFGMD